jgi:hypothetical protein
VDRARATRLLVGLLAFAFVVSVVHYGDNYVNYDDYPQGGIGPAPAPSAAMVGLGWFAFALWAARQARELTLVN